MNRSILVLACMLVGPACRSDRDDDDDDDGNDDDGVAMLEARTLVGDVDSSDILLGAIVEDDALTIYACGGLDTYATHSRWFIGTIGDEGDPDAFDSTSDGLRLQGRRENSGLFGTFFDRDGSEHAFAIRPPDEDTLAGLYFADVDGCRTGVVLANTPHGIDGQGTYCDAGGQFIQVIILQPVALAAGGVPVQVDKPDGPLTFSVAPL